jgi:hypothetical protein
MADQTNPLPNFGIRIPLIVSMDPLVRVEVTGDDVCPVPEWPAATRVVSREVNGSLVRARWGENDRVRVDGLARSIAAINLAHAFGSGQWRTRLTFGSDVIGDPGLVAEMARKTVALRPEIRPIGRVPRFAQRDHVEGIAAAYLQATRVLAESARHLLPLEIGQALVLPEAMLQLSALLLIRTAWLLGWFYWDMPLVAQLGPDAYCVIAHAGGIVTVGQVYRRGSLLLTGK